jgi:hypothetical protein
MSEMQFNEVGGAVKYINVAPNGKPAFKAGDIMVEGTFKRTFKGKFGLNHEFLVNGDKVVVNGFGHLNYKMQDIAEGSICRIIYLGKEKLTKGAYAGRESHQCKLLVASVSTVMKEVESTASADDSFLE